MIDGVTMVVDNYAKRLLNYAKKNNIPVIATMHSQYKQDFLRAVKFKPFANILTKKIIKQFNRCTECWAVNSEIANIYYNEYGYKEATIAKDVNGFISENDETKFAEKIIEIMKNEELYKRVCENAFKDIYINWDEKIQEVFDLYTKFIEKNGF